MTIREAIDRYERQAGPAFARILRNYFRAGTDLGDRALAEYLDGLLRSGRRRSTADLHYRTVRAFARWCRDELRLQVEVPRVRGWRYDASEARRPDLEAAAVVAMIAAARAGRLTSRQAASVALSSLYGLRASEIASLSESDVRPEEERVWLRAAKGGEQRWTWLPPAVAPYLEGLQPVPLRVVHEAFRSVWRAALPGERPPAVGWHALRRSLVRELVLRGAPQADVGRFLRWRRSGSRGGAEQLVDWYAHGTHTVSVSGDVRARVETDGTREADAAVWSAHPWLAAWEEPARPSLDP